MQQKMNSNEMNSRDLFIQKKHIHTKKHAKKDIKLHDSRPLLTCHVWGFGAEKKTVRFDDLADEYGIYKVETVGVLG